LPLQIARNDPPVCPDEALSSHHHLQAALALPSAPFAPRRAVPGMLASWKEKTGKQAPELAGGARRALSEAAIDPLQRCRHHCGPGLQVHHISYGLRRLDDCRPLLLAPTSGACSRSSNAQLTNQICGSASFRRRSHSSQSRGAISRSSSSTASWKRIFGGGGGSAFVAKTQQWVSSDQRSSQSLPPPHPHDP
jgi:hypothetical protein